MKNLLFGSLALIIVSILLSSCSDEQGNGTTSIRELTGGSDGNGYTIEIYSSNGTVTKSPDKTSYNAGDTVTLTATPANGYKFNSWGGFASGTNSTITVIMNSNMNVIANFRSLSTPTYLLTINATNGTVTKSPDKPAYDSGDVVALTAHPNSGYAFAAWGGDTVGTGTTISIMMNRDKTVNAAFQLLNIPVITAVTSGDGSVTLSWNSVTGATSYNIYYAVGSTVDKTGTKITGATSPKIINGLTNGEPYAFAVSAVFASGESGLSTIQTATPILPIPVIASAISGNGSVILSWNSIAGATSYNVYYAIDSTVDKTGTKITGATSPKTITGLTNGTQYAFAVSAIFAGGESGLSVIQTATTALSIPVITTAIPGDGSVTLSWNNIPGAISYNIYYAAGSTVDKTGTKIIGATSPKTITGLANGTQYAFVMSAVFAGGESGLSAIQVAKPTLTIPVISSATSGNGSVVLSWNNVVGATSYNVYYAAGSMVDKTGTKITGATSPKTITGLTNGTQYAFAISAVFAGGESGLSSIQTATTSLIIPSITTLTSSDGSVIISWNSIAGATSYNIYYAMGSTVNKTGTKITGSTSPTTITGLTNGTQYTFAVSTIYTGGESELSSIKTATPALNIPVITAITSGNGSVAISWNNVAGATSYNIYYTAGSIVDKSGTKIAGATSPRTVTGLTNQTQYAFAISAVSTAFTGGESGLSTIQTAIPALPIPVITATISSEGAVTIIWNSDIGATSYNIYYSTGSMVDKTGTKITGAILPNTVTGLTNQTQYAFAMSAVFTGGESGLSSIQTATPHAVIITGTVTDIDGNVYHSVTIGTQVWMVENLKTTKLNDGTAIPIVTDGTIWDALTTPGCCWYNNDSASNKNTYGALYNWYAVNTGILAPTGWHVPTDSEWSILTTYLGGENVAGGALKESGTTHWISPNSGATNITGFTALPGGSHLGKGGFYSIGNYGQWWTATENTSNADIRRLYYNNASSVSSYDARSNGQSVRLIKDP